MNIDRKNIKIRNDNEVSLKDIILNLIKNRNPVIFKDISDSVKEIIKDGKANFDIKKVSGLVKNTFNEYKNNSNEKWINIKPGNWFLVKKEYHRIEFNLINDEKSERFANLVYDIYSQILNKDLTIKELISLNLIEKEAISSNTIEGNTISTKEEYNKRQEDDIEKIAINRSIELIKLLNSNKFFYDQKISILNFISVHKFLFQDFLNTSIFNGESAGDFKKTQNYISGGFKPADYLVVESEMEFLIEEFNKKPKNIYEAFQRSSYIHLLFEMIHPFSDGNGRVGRLFFSYYFLYHEFFDSLIINISSITMNFKNKYKKILFDENYSELSDLIILNFVKKIIIEISIIIDKENKLYKKFEELLTKLIDILLNSNLKNDRLVNNVLHSFKNKNEITLKQFFYFMKAIEENKYFNNEEKEAFLNYFAKNFKLKENNQFLNIDDNIKKNNKHFKYLPDLYKDKIKWL